MIIKTKFNINTYIKIPELDNCKGLIISIKQYGPNDEDRWYEVRWFHNGKAEMADFLEQELLK